MQFLYHKLSGQPFLEIEGEAYKYLFRVRRLKQGSLIETRNLKDNKLYLYRVNTISKREAFLELVSSQESIVLPQKRLHLGWCIIDPKVVEKSLPALNETGVEKITFIKCAYSQANFKIKKDRLEKILINSCQQCGRSTLMHIEFANSLNEFLQKNPESYLLDFSEKKISSNSNIESIVVGCEGGLSEDERSLFNTAKRVGFNTPLILRSESAAVAAAAKIIL